jgi:hypothetical protein
MLRNQSEHGVSAVHWLIPIGLSLSFVAGGRWELQYHVLEYFAART